MVYVNFDLDLKGTYSVFSMTAISTISSILLGTLSGFHVWLACDGMTTNEDLRGKFSRDGVNPYNKGIRMNCYAFWYGGSSRLLNAASNTNVDISQEPNVFIIV